VLGQVCLLTGIVCSPGWQFIFANFRAAWHALPVFLCCDRNTGWRVRKSQVVSAARVTGRDNPGCSVVVTRVSSVVMPCTVRTPEKYPHIDSWRNTT